MLIQHFLGRYNRLIVLYIFQGFSIGLLQRQNFQADELRKSHVENGLRLHFAKGKALNIL